MNSKKGLLRTLILTSSLAAASSLPIIITNTIVNNNEVSLTTKNASSSDYSFVIGHDKFASYDYNNTFAWSYGENFSIGVNTRTSSTNFTNGQLMCSNSQIFFKASFSDEATRSVSNTTAVVSDPWGYMNKGITDSRENMIAIKRNSLVNNKEEFKESLTSMKQLTNATTWNEVTDWQPNGTQTVNQEFELEKFEKPIFKVNLLDNSSVSAVVNIGSDGSGTMVSQLHFRDDPGFTDHSADISECVGLSKTFTNQNNYAGLTYVKSNINEAQPGQQTIEVYSGDTKFTDNPITYSSFDIKTQIKQKYSASDWLKVNTSLFEERISIGMENGYPGVLSNSLSIVADNETGNINAVFLPKQVLKAGCVVDYTGKAYTKTLVSGFKPQPKESEDSSTNVWMWVGIGIGIAVVIAIAVTVTLVLLKKKKKSKRDKHGRIHVPINNRPALGNSSAKPNVNNSQPNVPRTPQQPQNRPMPPKPNPGPQNRPVPPKPPMPGARSGTSPQRPGMAPRR